MQLFIANGLQAQLAVLRGEEQVQRHWQSPQEGMALKADHLGGCVLLHASRPVKRFSNKLAVCTAWQQHWQSPERDMVIKGSTSDAVFSDMFQEEVCCLYSMERARFWQSPQKCVGLKGADRPSGVLESPACTKTGESFLGKFAA